MVQPTLRAIGCPDPSAVLNIADCRCAPALPLRWLLLAVLLCGGAGTAACRRSAEAGDTTVLRIGIGVSPSARASTIATFSETLYLEPLITRRLDGRHEAHLAESWHWENSGRRLRVRLKQALKLHSGETLTPALVARFLNAQIAGARAQIPSAYPTVSSVTDQGGEVVLDLTGPDAFLLSDLLGERISHPDNRAVGTGPFKLVAGSSNLETERFDAYHGGRSRLAGVRIVPYDTQRSAWAALLRGDVDAVQEVSRESVEFLEGSSNVRTYAFLQPFYIPVVFNLAHPVLKNAEVRRALTVALDRESIVKHAMKGRGRVADGPIWPLHWAFSPPRGRYGYDPTGAGARLDRAGYPLPRQQPSGGVRARFTFRCLFWAEDSMYERIALTVQRQWFDIGVQVILEPLPLPALRDRAQAGTFDSFLVRTNASRSLDLAYRFWRSAAPHETPMQRSGYRGADRLLDELRQSATDQSVPSTVAELSQRFFEDAPAAFLAWTEITRAVSTKFEIPDAGSDDPFSNLWQWRPDTSRDAP